MATNMNSLSKYGDMWLICEKKSLLKGFDSLFFFMDHIYIFRLK
jgi:hypothetical protein